MGIHPGARFPARSADALSATLYGHFTQAVYIGLFVESCATPPSNTLMTSAAEGMVPAGQGLTLVHLSAQRKRFLWHKGYLGGV
jgi:hypothetical protein